MGTVYLHVEDGSISSPFGPVGAGLDPCVIVSAWVVEATREAELPLCAFARRLLGPGGTGHTVGDVMTINARDRTLRYRIYPAEFDDGPSPEPFYLGVLDQS